MMDIRFEVDNRCECGGKLTWIQLVRLFDKPDTVELTMRCDECWTMFDVQVVLKGDEDE